MRCHCCDAPDAKFDGTDWYCVECQDWIDELISEDFLEYEDFDLGDADD